MLASIVAAPRPRASAKLAAMGGNLFKLGRKPRAEYLEIEAEVRSFLDDLIGEEGYRIPRYYGDKPEFGDLDVGDGFQKHSYPWGIMVNAHGRRFVDEGADFRNYTYARYGRVILDQPDGMAWQIFDQKVTGILRDEYRIKRVTKVSAPTLEALADKLEGVDKAGFLDEIARYNAAVRTDIAFDPNVKDGRRTEGLKVPKSNWANTIDEGPFEAYQVGCGVTFTFGGLRIDPDSGAVMDTDLAPIPGLFAAGELIGGVFYFNYPGGTGLINGAVFGRLAGANAA